MAILDVTARKTISRRLCKLPTEKGIFTTTSSNLNDTLQAYSEVDSSNDLFLVDWVGSSDAYLGERRSLAGLEFETFTVLEAENEYVVPLTGGGNSKFFPFNSGLVPALSNNYFLNPQINRYTDGLSSGAFSPYEERIALDYQQMLIILINGVTGGINTALSAPFNSGDIVLNVVDGSGTSDGTCVIVSGNDGGGIPVNSQYLFYIESGGGTNTLTGHIVCGGTSTIIVVGSTIAVGGGVIWADHPDRDDLAASLTFPNVAQGISSYGVISWGICLTDELVDLGLNIDTRITQQALITAAIAVNIPAIQAGITAWTAFPLSDVGGNSRFNDVALLPFQIEVDDRVIQIAGRLGEIVTAVGSVTDGGDGTYITVDGAFAFRYQWLDRRINKGYGSLASQDGADKTKKIIDQQNLNAQSMEQNYKDAMVATLFVENPEDFFSDMEGFSSALVASQDLRVITVISIPSAQTLYPNVVTEVPAISASLLQAVSGATAIISKININNNNIVSFYVSDIVGTFDSTNLVTGVNLDKTTFSFVPANTFPSLYQFERGDDVFVIDDSLGNAELPSVGTPGRILHLDFDNNQIYLDFEVPATYTPENLVRIYKCLIAYV